MLPYRFAVKGQSRENKVFYSVLKTKTKAHQSKRSDTQFKIQSGITNKNIKSYKELKTSKEINNLKSIIIELNISQNKTIKNLIIFQITLGGRN